MNKNSAQPDAFEPDAYVAVLHIPRSRYAQVRKKLDSLIRREKLSCELRPEVSK